MIPEISVVVPVRDGGAGFEACLAALAASDLPRGDWELIVVDDGSSDSSAVVASRFADLVVRLPGVARGAAYCRNRGAEMARGEIVVFIDPDVSVHPDTLRRFAEALRADAALGAVFGAHDGESPARGVVSQYWNLLQHYSSQRNAGQSTSFGTACGAIRRAVLMEVGGFDEWHLRETRIAHLELGSRLRRAGVRVELRADIAATHLREWTLRSMVSDLWGRGVMLTRLLGYSDARAQMRSDALHTLARASSLLAIIGGVGVLTAAQGASDWIAIVGIPLAGILLVNHSIHRFLFARRGLTFTLMASPLHVVAEIVSAAALVSGWLLRNIVGEPTPDPTTQALAEVGAKTWPPVPKRR